MPTKKLKKEKARLVKLWSKDAAFWDQDRTVNAEGVS